MIHRLLRHARLAEDRCLHSSRRHGVDAYPSRRKLGREPSYKAAGCGGPTLYRHNENANLAFYDGHVETWRKNKLWVPEHYNDRPYKPDIWVVKERVWKANGGAM